MWALTANEMKECRWLKPELVAQIEFTEWTPDGHLRHSSFVGLRRDKEARKVGSIHTGTVVSNTMGSRGHTTRNNCSWRNELTI
jgi:hypothetical protein